MSPIAIPPPQVISPSMDSTAHPDSLHPLKQLQHPLRQPQPTLGPDLDTASAASSSAGPSYYTAKQTLSLPDAQAFQRPRRKVNHFLDLSEMTHHHAGSGFLGLHDIEVEGDGVRTPRPMTLTPSPPASRRGSMVVNGEREGESERERRTAHGVGEGVENGTRAVGRLASDESGGSPERADDARVNNGPLEKDWMREENEMARLLRTVDFAARKHTCQRRKDLDQSPYINHPIAVANFLSSTGITDVRVLQAAILHDTVEDTHTSIEEIADHFGPDVARIVAECTDAPNQSAQAAKAEQIRTAPFKSREAQQVKLADKLHNLESIRRVPPTGWTVRRVQAYFVWAKQVTDICAPAHPALGQRLQRLYETAYTEIDGNYFPCHPDVCGPLLEEEKERIDARIRCLKKGEKPAPYPIFF